MTNWNKQTETPLPFNVSLVLTNGIERVIGKVTHDITQWPDGEHHYYGIDAEGISGYEWETEFLYKDITHWMLAPELP